MGSLSARFYTNFIREHNRIWPRIFYDTDIKFYPKATASFMCMKMNDCKQSDINFFNSKLSTNENKKLYENQTFFQHKMSWEWNGFFAEKSFEYIYTSYAPSWMLLFIWHNIFGDRVHNIRATRLISIVCVYVVCCMFSDLFWYVNRQTNRNTPETSTRKNFPPNIH